MYYYQLQSDDRLLKFVVDGTSLKSFLSYDSFALVDDDREYCQLMTQMKVPIWYLMLHWETDGAFDDDQICCDVLHLHESQMCCVTSLRTPHQLLIH